jgi:CBS domain-containing protein
MNRQTHRHRPTTVRDEMRVFLVSVDETAKLPRILAEMEKAGVDELAVVGGGGAFRGMVERRPIERQLYDRGDRDSTAATFAEEAIARARPSEPIDEAVATMLAADRPILPVVSARGRLEGLLLLEDVKRVPGLVEAIAERKRERASTAEAGLTRMHTACSLASAALGMVLLALWIEGPAYGLPGWVSWVDALAALLAFVGAVAVSSGEMFSVPLWAVGGVGLCFAAGLGHSWHDGTSSTWFQLAPAIAFFTMVIAIGTAVPRGRHARIGHHHTAPVRTSS